MVEATPFNLGQRVKNTLLFLRGRKIDYVQTFMNPVGQRVLDDLVRYCNGLQTSYRDDAREHARQEGRRDVLLRIQYHCGLNPQQLFNLYKNPNLNVEENINA